MALAVPDFVRRAGALVLDAVLPPQCLACSATVDAPGRLCARCWNSLAWIAAPFCARCGTPFEFDPAAGAPARALTCAPCLAEPPRYDRARAVLVYDDTRLAKCKGEQGGVPQYAVTAYASVDGAAADTVVVAGLNAQADPTIELSSAGELEIWFEVTNKWGCHEWDSDFGNNYRFQVAAE